MSSTGSSTGTVLSALMEAFANRDAAALVALYDPALSYWHNYDQQSLNLEQHLATLGWMANELPDRSGSEVTAVHVAGDVGVVQYTLRGTSRSGVLVDAPCCMIVHVRNGKIVRVEEYLDSADFAGLTPP